MSSFHDPTSYPNAHLIRSSAVASSLSSDHQHHQLDKVHFSSSAGDRTSATVGGEGEASAGSSDDGSLGEMSGRSSSDGRRASGSEGTSWDQHELENGVGNGVGVGAGAGGSSDADELNSVASLQDAEGAKFISAGAGGSSSSDVGSRSPSFSTRPLSGNAFPTPLERLQSASRERGNGGVAVPNGVVGGMSDGQSEQGKDGESVGGVNGLSNANANANAAHPSRSNNASPNRPTVPAIYTSAPWTPSTPAQSSVDGMPAVLNWSQTSPEEVSSTTSRNWTNGTTSSTSKSTPPPAAHPKYHHNQGSDSMGGRKGSGPHSHNGSLNPSSTEAARRVSVYLPIEEEPTSVNGPTWPFNDPATQRGLSLPDTPAAPLRSPSAINPIFGQPPLPGQPQAFPYPNSVPSGFYQSMPSPNNPPAEDTKSHSPRSQVRPFYRSTSSSSLNNQQSDLAKKLDTPAAWLALYFTLNLSLTLYNKLVLVKYPFPWTLTGIHTLCGAIGSQICLNRGLFVQARLSRREGGVLIAFSVLYTVNIAVSNLSLQLVTVPFHQVVRAMTPLFTLGIATLLLRKKHSSRTYAALIPVILGVVFATYGDYSWTTWGLILTVLGTVLAALKTVVTNMIQVGRLKLHPLDLLLRMSPLAFVQCVVYAWWSGELARVREFGATQMDWNRAMGLLINGVIAFGLNVVSFTANKKTSALTMTVAANVKQVLTIILAVVIFNLNITPMNFVGISLTLAGGAYYAKVEFQEKKQRAAPPAPLSVPPAPLDQQNEKQRSYS